MKKRIVSFLLALVMAVSLLPVSAFAVDGAYTVAKDTTVQRRDYADMIAVQAATEPEQVNGVYQIKTADELLWFRNFANKSSGRSANAVLCNDIDMSSVSDWKTPIGKSLTYKGVFDGNGYKILNLTYKPTQTAGAGRALFGKVDSIGVIRNLGLCNANIAAETSAQSDTHVAVLAGINNGTIFNCYIASSKVSIKSKATPNAGILCGYNNGTIENCYCINSSITDANTNTTITGDLGGIAGGNKGAVKNAYAANITISTKGTQNLHPIAVGNVENVYYIKANDDTRTYTGGTEKDAAWFQSEAAVTALGAEYFTQDTAGTNGGYPVLTFAKEAADVVDKSELEKALAAFPTSGYYTQNDRYNGRCTSANGFWSDYRKLTAGAWTVYGNENATADEVAKAVKDLQDSSEKIQAAIANLIPADRANTTLLYEALKNTPSSNDDTYTAKSWAAYQTVRDKAEVLMATMFNAEGNPIDDNKATANKSIETMAAELETARKALDAKSNTDGQTVAKLQIEAIRYLAKQYEPDALTGYTAESIETLRQARAAAVKLADETPLDDLGQNQRYPLTAALRELRKAIYGLTTTAASQIKVKVSVLDTNDIHHGYTGELAYLHNPNTYTASLTLDANASAYDLLSGKNLLKNQSSTAEAVVFLNGELVYGDLGDTSKYHDLDYAAGSENSTFQAIKLHDKDELTIVWIYPKQVEYSSQVGTYPMFLSDAPDWFRYSTVSAPVEVEAGQPFTISVNSETALPFHSAAGTRAVTGAAVYRSDAAESAEAAATGYVGVNTYAVTDESGKATLTLYNEGYVLLNAFRTDTDEARYTVGASVLVHVTAASDLDAVKQQLRTELDAVYNDEQHPESVFTAENWQKVQDAYNTAVAAIDAAKTSGEAGDAQQKAIQTIKGLQSSADSNNKANLVQFRRLLAQLPDDVTKLDATAADTVAQLKTCYEAMTVYQRGQLTGREQKKYNAIANAELAPAVSRKLTFRQDYSSVPAADQAALADMIAYLQNNTRKDDKYTPEIGGNMQAQLFSFNTTRDANYGTAYARITEAASLTQNIVACVNPDYAAYLLCRDAAISAGKKDGPGVITGDGWRISDESTTMYVPDENVSNTTRVLGHMTYTVNGTQYAVKSVTVSGLETDTTSRNATFYDTSLYRGRFPTQCNQVIPDTFLQMTTGFDDVTVTVIWAPVGGDAQAAKDAAITRLNTVKNGLTGDGVQAAYDAGVKAIQAAATAAEVDKAYQAAVVAMRKAADYGKVQVIVENTTYPVEDGAPWDGKLVDEWIDLNADSTMMNCIVAALEKKGYTQDGAESGYIATINGLSQMDGGGNSGWMGTLNDWFTNYGFKEFTVENGSLSNGDVIHIVYTREGLGADVGGTWGNSDTTLTALDIQGGKLLTKFAPGEAGNTYEYTLAIDGKSADLKLTPTAANKNYLTKIFLNEKVTSDEEGGSFFKRTQKIPVAAGDTIYVGCGEYAWPSMNKQETEARDYTGTWYVLHVVNASAGASYVDDLIDALPDASDVSYDNYQQYGDAAEVARKAYEDLDKAEQGNVDTAELAKVEAAIAQFKAIDDVKAKIDALPEAGKVTLAESDAVKAAQDAYDALTAEQKDYLTFAQSAKVTALAKRIAELEAAPIKSVEELIDAIGTVSLDSKSAIDEARAAYDKLTAEQQAKVSNYAALTAAETAYAKLAADKADQDAADAVIAKINAIGTVTLDSKSAIDEARKAYDGLTKAQQAKVSNYAALTAAETTYAKLVADKADQDAADAVIAKINAIGTVTLKSKKAIDAARKAYDKLTAAQQARVSNYATLTTAETTYAKLVQDKADQDAADAVIAKINAIGTVTLKSKKSIDAARKAYDALTAAQQARVSNYATLTTAETTYAKLVQDKADQDAADAVIAKINAIGTVTLKSKKSIDAARKAYDALTAAQQARVSNYATLTTAETTYAKLVQDKADQDAADAAIAKINAIGVVSRAAKSRIDAARKAYDGLTDAQKALVPASVVKTLTDAETAYSNLPPRHSSDDTVDSTKPAQSSRTGDAGIAIYAAMSLLSVTGGAWVIGKKRKH